MLFDSLVTEKGNFSLGRQSTEIQKRSPLPLEDSDDENREENEEREVERGCEAREG